MSGTKHIDKIKLTENKDILVSILNDETVKLSRDYILNGRLFDYRTWAEKLSIIVIPEEWDMTDPTLREIMNIYSQIFYWMIKTNSDKLIWHSIDLPA